MEFVNENHFFLIFNWYRSTSEYRENTEDAESFDKFYPKKSVSMGALFCLKQNIGKLDINTFNMN
jgi:hypothetical protein